ncbi:MAG: hypothetical protein JWO80_5675 [Bryobacterales bacterium]|nr:hypothetical protein [Bryobacterales bacterium]
MTKAQQQRRRLNVRHQPLVGFHPAGPETQARPHAFSDFELVTQTSPPVFGNTALVDQGGPRIDFADIRLIFWGSAWASDPNRSAIMNAVASVAGSPYATKLAQYGCRGMSVDGRGPLLITSNPPNPFTGQNVGDFILSLLDNETLPEPDEDFRLVPVVLMPSGFQYQPPAGGQAAFGAHGSIEWDDFELGDVDNSNAHYVWILNRSVSGMTSTFCHEMVEIVTDPEGNGWRVPTAPNGQDEIGDICNNLTLTSGGVNYHYYWSAQDNACVLPINQTGQYQVTCINKPFRKDAFHPLGFLGGVHRSGPLNGQGFKLTQKEAIALIDKGENFFVIGSEGHRAPVNVLLHFPPGHEVFGTRYLATGADQWKDDNLLSLPECP